MVEPPGDEETALQDACRLRDASRAACADAERAAARLHAACDEARARVAEALARGASLCVLSDLWRVPPPDSDAVLRGGDADAAAAVARPSPEALWGGGADDVAARGRLAHLLQLCKQVHEAECGVASLAQRAQAAALKQAEQEVARALRGDASPLPPRHTAESALRDWHAACVAAQAADAASHNADAPCFDARWSGASASSPLARVAWSTRRGGVVLRLAATAPPGAALNALVLECALDGVAAAAPFWLATRGDPAEFTRQVVWPALDARTARVRAAADADAAMRRQEQPAGELAT